VSKSLSKKWEKLNQFFQTVLDLGKDLKRYGKDTMYHFGLGFV